MASPAEVVAEQFSQSRTTADYYMGQTTTFISHFTDALFPAALVDVTFAPVAAPTAISIPDTPAFPDAPTWDAGTAPADPSIAAPDITVDDFTEAAPVLVMPDAPVLDFPSAPEIVIGDAPVVPDIATIAVPDAPTIDAVALPDFLTLTTPTFAGIDLHTDFLDNLNTVPTLDIAAPTPFSFTPGDAYTDSVLDAVKARLAERLDGTTPTGIPAAVENAMWDRLRNREVQIGAANEAEVLRTHEALGFQLPSGALAAQLRAAQVDTLNRISTGNREIVIKQADLEQSNVRDAITAGIQLETQLIDYAYRLEQIAFDTAKETAANAVQIFNGQVQHLQALVAAYQAYAQAYKTLIDGELAKVEVYRAEIAGEQAKADTNRTLVEEYKAQIDASLALVRIFEAQVGAAKTRMELEQVKIAAAGEQIRGYVAQINGQTAKVELFKAGVQAQATKSEAYKIGVDAQASIAGIYETKAKAFSAKASAQAEKARVNLGYYNAQAAVFAAKTSAYSARATAESERFRAIASLSTTLNENYRAQVQAVLGKADQDIKRWETQIKEYEATQTYTFQATKANNDVLQARGQMLLDATKAGAQILAQLSSSALSVIRVSAGVSASASNGVSYNYSNDTNATVDPVTAV
jgi:hypothetical protein